MVLISLAIILPIRYFLVQPFFVKGQSMEPSFYDGDYLIIDQLSFRLREPERGEVVVFRFPQDPSQFYIKRIIALPGETVEIRGGKIFIWNSQRPSGFILNEPYVKKGIVTEGVIRKELKSDEYFVLGDNRRASYDSRRWGAVKRKNLVGRVWLRPWPIARAEVFHAPAY